MFGEKVDALIRRDGLYIIVCAFALFACIWTVGSANDYQNECNTHWQQQLEECGCYDSNIVSFEKNFSLMLPLEHLNTNEVFINES